MFVMGGNDGSSFLSSCEVYDPVSNKWSFAAPMNRQRAGLGADVLDGLLYVSGMYFSLSHLTYLFPACCLTPIILSVLFVFAIVGLTSIKYDFTEYPFSLAIFSGPLFLEKAPPVSIITKYIA